jgi:hypothetical protein
MASNCNEDGKSNSLYSEGMGINNDERSHSGDRYGTGTYGYAKILI